MDRRRAHFRADFYDFKYRHFKHRLKPDESCVYRWYNEFKCVLILGDEDPQPSEEGPSLFDGC